MNDAENLSKLLGHLSPAVFREFMVEEFSLTMPDLDTKKLKKEQREQMEAVLSALRVGERQQIEEVAERIVLLSDGAGQDVINGFKDDIFDDAAREAFAAIPNQYQRALWLHTNEPVIFEEALNARQADVFRQNASCYSYANHPTGSPWVEALQASVRPVITYAFFLVFAVVKVSALATLLQTDGVTLAASLQATWDEETQALFAAVMSFWFGSRQISKMRRGG